MAFTLDTDASTASTDVYVGTEDADVFDPTVGNPDIGNGKDIISGLGGDDTIGAGNGDDVLIGGEGGDTLTGGNGADTFNYSFTMETSSGGSGPLSYAEYLGEIDPTQQTQNEFSTSYSAWLNYLVFGDGGDWGGLKEKFGWGDDVTIGLNQNSTDDDGTPHISGTGVDQADLDAIFGTREELTWTKGKASQTRSYWDLDSNYDWGGETTVSSDDGKDTITDFKVSDGDMLFFTIDAEGDGTTLTAQEKDDLITEFKTKFDITTGDFDGDTNVETTNPDTKMVLDDGDADATNDMSITLLGYNGGASIWGYVEFSFV